MDFVDRHFDGLAILAGWLAFLIIIAALIYSTARK